MVALATPRPTSDAFTTPLIQADEAVYAAGRAAHLSSHALSEFRRNPLLYRKKQLGLVVDHDHPAYRLGRAAHCRILEGAAAFRDRFAIGGPINPKTGACYGIDTKAYAAWADAQGKPAIGDADAALCEQLAEAVRGHTEASALLDAGMPEGVVRCTYADEPCQIRIDWTHPERGIVDLKTCDDLDWFESQSRSFGYVYQLAFYRAVLTQVLGRAAPVHIIAVEKREPFRVGVWHLSDQILDACARENVAAIARLHHCRTLDRWPTGYEQIRHLDYLA